MYQHRRRNRLSSWALLVVGMLLLVSQAVQADCPDNLLTNGGFEEGFSARGAGEVQVANGWHPWYQDGPDQQLGYNHRPEYNPENAAVHGTRRIREGSFAQKWGKVYATHHAGIYQQVNVRAGSTLKLTAWGQSWSSDKDDPSVSDGGKYLLSVGIDPTGGTDWASPNVVWSAPSATMDQWVQLSVEARAQGGTVTVYLRGDAEWPVKHNDAYFDDVCLTYVSTPPPPTNTPRPTSTPNPEQTPSEGDLPAETSEPGGRATPAPGGQETVHIVQAGEYLSVIAARYGVSMYDIAEANGIRVNDIIRVGQRLIIPAAGPTPTPSPTETPVATPTPVGGVIRVAAFDDRNGNGLRDPGEPLIAGARITLMQADGTVVGEHVTDGVSEPYAFVGLASGTYRVLEVHPPGYVSSRQDEWVITLGESDEYEVFFADRSEEAGATEPAAPTPAPPEVPTAPGSDEEAESSELDTIGNLVRAYSGILVALAAVILPLVYWFLRARV